MKGITALAVFTLAVGLRVSYIAWSPPALDGDQRAYLGLAESISTGQGYRAGGAPQTHISPLFPLLHAAASKLVPDALAAGRATAVLIASLVPVAAFWAFSGLLGLRGGLAAAILIAVHPHLIVRSSLLEPESLAALLAFFLAGSLERGWTGLSGIALGLAYLSRPELLLLLPVVALLLAFRSAGWKRVALFAGLCLAMSSPFLIYLRLQTGRWRLSGKDRWVYVLGVHQWRSGDRPLEPDELARLQEEIGSPLSHAVSHPRELVSGYAYRGALLARNLARATSWILLPFLVIGAGTLWKTARGDALPLLLPLVLLPALPLGLTLYRHTMTVTPLLVGIAGAGILPPVEAVRRSLSKDR